MRKSALLAVVLAVGGCYAQTPDPNELVHKALANYEARQIQAQDYTYLEHDSAVDPGNVKPKKDSAFYEVLVTNGQEYRVELHDRKPMTPEEVERAIQDFASSSRKWADEEITRPIVGETIVWPWGTPHLSLKDLPEFFETHFAGEEMLEGRRTYVLEAKAKHGQQPSDEIISDLRTFKMKIWIDQADTQFMKVKAVAIHPGVLGYPIYARVKPDYPDSKQAEKSLYSMPEKYSQGTTILMEWRKINDEVWLPTRIQVKGNHLDPIYLTPLQMAGTLDSGYREWPFERDSVFYDYQKFRVTHRMPFSESH